MTEEPEELEHTAGHCWCKPTLFYRNPVTGACVWVHKGPGDELPPAWILAEAIADTFTDENDDAMTLYIG